jgi:hypothetical protein
MRTNIRFAVLICILCTLIGCSTVGIAPDQATQTIELIATVSEIGATPHPAADSEGCPKMLPRYPDATIISQKSDGEWERTAMYEFTGQPSKLFDYYDDQLLPVGWHAHARKSQDARMQHDISYNYRFHDAILILELDLISKKQDTYQYFVRLGFGSLYANGLSEHCSHLYP